ncbi:MAG: acyl-CoA dehydrogenase family protein [Chloroflexota bacterium]|nr:acyl-CoA dehydrogenase family protein [Chloroflexota bacterium]
MDFSLTPEQEALRKEFDEFFAEEERRSPPGWVAAGPEGQFLKDEWWAYHRSVAVKLGKKRWLTLHWPKEFGGMNHGPVEQLMFAENRRYHRVPGVDNQGPGTVAAALMLHGTKEQQNEWLPPIANGDINWGECFSEPNAGSDLASLTTRAVEDGDDYVLNGQKTWTSGGHRADHFFILARTDPNLPRHRGLSYFLTRKDAPGIEVRPILSMNRTHARNEVFFDNLRISKRNLIGEVNRGWYLIMGGRNLNRAGAASIVGEMRRDLEDLVQFCRETQRGGRALAQEPVVRHRLAELALEVEAARQWAYYVAWLQSKGVLVAGEAASSKSFATELAIRLSNVAVEIMGLYGTLKEGSKWVQLSGRFEALCQENLGFAIAGGTTEIQKNIVAWMKLGLPRS